MDEPSASVSKEPLGALLSNPALLETVQKVLGSINTPVSEPTNNAPSPQVPSLPDGLSGLLSNPELLSKIPMLLKVLTATASPREGEKKEGEALPVSALSMSPQPSKKGHGQCRNDLLLALKPFLSKERCDAIDLILRLSVLGNALKQLQ